MLAHRHGTLTAADIPEHIRTKFERKRRRGAPDDCWPWTTERGSTSTSYGLASWPGSQEKTHRIALALAGIDIPAGMLVLHSCDWPPCCNPAHLRLGTHLDNLNDRRERGDLRRCRPVAAPSHAQ